MVVTGLCFVTVTVLVKLMGSRIPAAEAAFLRYVLGLVFVIPMLRPLFAEARSPQIWGLSAARGLVHSLGVTLWFYSMTRIPLAEITAINYLSPVYVTIGAALFLGETLALRRIAAICAALIGALLILRPGFRELDPGHFAIMGTAFLFGCSYLLAKRLADRVSPSVVVAMLSIWVTIGLFPLALAEWVAPEPRELVLLFVVASAATLGHYTMTLAFRAAPITVTQPVTFLQLVWATAFGALLFAEPVDLWVVAGGLVIMGAVSFITWREAVLRRRPITPTTPATKV